MAKKPGLFDQLLAYTRIPPRLLELVAILRLEAEAAITAGASEPILTASQGKGSRRRTFRFHMIRVAEPGDFHCCGPNHPIRRATTRHVCTIWEELSPEEAADLEARRAGRYSGRNRTNVPRPTMIDWKHYFYASPSENSTGAPRVPFSTSPDPKAIIAARRLNLPDRPEWTPEDVRTARRELMKVHHPDRPGGSVQAAQEINDAADYLLNRLEPKPDHV